MARSPFQRSIQIRHLDDAKAGEKLLRLGIGAIVDLAFPIADRDSRRGLRRLQSRTADKDTRSLQGLTIGLPSRHGRWVIAAVEVFLWLVNEYCVFHNLLFLVCSRRETSPGSIMKTFDGHYRFFRAMRASILNCRRGTASDSKSDPSDGKLAS